MNTSALSTALPKVCSVDEFAQHFGLKPWQGYCHIKKLPENCLFKLGRRIFVNLDALSAYMSSGGTL